MNRLFIITAFIIGILLALQVRSFKKVDVLLQRFQPATVLAELRTLQLANEQLRENVAQAERTLQETRSKIAGQTIEEEMQRLKLLSGAHAITGEGIEITISSAVDSFWITDIIAQLVTSGAEAVAVNDVRLTMQTAGFRSVGGGLLMRRNFLRSPLRISAIGPSEMLKQAVTQSGGILDRMKRQNRGLAALVSQQENIIIPALPAD